MATGPSDRRAEDAKSRVLRSIAFIAWGRDADGEPLGSHNLNKALQAELMDSPDVSSAYARLSRGQKTALRHKLEHPAVDYIDSDNRSWSGDDLAVLRLLEQGKRVPLDKPRR